MRNYLKKWFRPTRAESFSGILLTSASALSFCLPIFYPILFNRNVQADFSEFSTQIQSFLNQKSIEKPIAATWNSPKRSTRKTPQIRLFEFNPNTASKYEFKELGLSDRVAQTVINYRNKGGQFFKKDDLSRIYGLRKEDFKRLKPYIVLSETRDSNLRQFADNEPVKSESKARVVTQKVLTVEDKAAEPFLIDINRATLEEWQKLKGIGPYFSKKILKFRKALGGFASVEQIADTYHLPDSVFQKIKPFLRPSSVLKTININTADIEELKAHPYLKYKQAKGIVNYRKNHGNFKSIKDLEKVGGALKAEDLKRMEPYLNFE